MSRQIRDCNDFLDCSLDWAEEARHEAGRLPDDLRASFLRSAPSPFASVDLRPGLRDLRDLGDWCLGRVAQLTDRLMPDFLRPLAGNIAGPVPVGGNIAGASTWVRRGVNQNGGQCGNQAGGSGAHMNDPECERVNCGDDILPFDTVTTTFAGGTNGFFTQVITGVRTLHPYWFFFIGLDTNAALAQIPARMINVKIGSNDQLISPNFNSLICTSIRQRIPIRWDPMSSDNSGQPIYNFANDLAAPATLRVLGMVQGEPNIGLS